MRSALGCGEGRDWDAAYADFDRAWKEVVLPRLGERFRNRPADGSAGHEPPPTRGTIAL